MSALKEVLKSGRANLHHQLLADAFTYRYPHGDPDQLMNENFPVFFSIILPKIIANIAFAHGWIGNHRKIYLYNRPEVGEYHMMTSVVSYKAFDDSDCLPGQSRRLI